MLVSPEILWELIPQLMRGNINSMVTFSFKVSQTNVSTGGSQGTLRLVQGWDISHVA